MQHKVHSGARAAAGRQVTDITLYESKPSPLPRSYALPHRLQVAAITGREIIQPNHALIQLKQTLQQVRANESGYSGHEPHVWSPLELFLQLFVG
jgi:hypothetical protein